jgi:hypothetical protein
MEDVMVRRWCLGIVGLTIVGGATVVGCSGEPVRGEEVGTLNLPLSTRGPSGTEYRLRDATFQISSSSYYYDDYGAGGEGSSGNYTVSSEDDPSASSITLSVERGYYSVRLLPGFRMEKIEDGEATNVEATLLSPATQWIYVYQRSSTWVSYEFGLGERSLWFNGDLTIGVQVYENPEQYYGGEGGYGGANDG